MTPRQNHIHIGWFLFSELTWLLLELPLPLAKFFLTLCPLLVFFSLLLLNFPPGKQNPCTESQFYKIQSPAITKQSILNEYGFVLAQGIFLEERHPCRQARKKNHFKHSLWFSFFFFKVGSHGHGNPAGCIGSE